MIKEAFLLVMLLISAYFLKSRHKTVKKYNDFEEYRVKVNLDCPGLAPDNKYRGKLLLKTTFTTISLASSFILYTWIGLLKSI